MNKNIQVWISSVQYMQRYSKGIGYLTIQVVD